MLSKKESHPFLHKGELIILLALSVLLFLGLWLEKEQSDLSGSVLRLHVLANSDRIEDQTLKLKVRDAVLEYTEGLFAKCDSKEQAQDLLAEELDSIKAVAEDILKKEGCDLCVSVELGEEEYPTRNYESCCFPSGRYTSLRIMIGEAKGQNWWCVLFPPLCLSAAAKNEEDFAQVGLSQDQYGVITQTEAPKYKIRFKILDTLGALGKN